MRRVFAMIVNVLSLLLLGGCGQIQCERAQALVRDRDRSEQLLEWADSAVFARTYSEADYFRARHKGLGPPFAIDLDVLGIRAPEQLGVLEVRVIGTDFQRPAGVYVAVADVSGVLIARKTLGQLLSAELPQTRVDFLSGDADRMVAYCGTYR